MGCHLNLARFDFAHDGINHCCTGVGSAAVPRVFSFKGGEFPFDAYLGSAGEYIQNNLRGEGPCKGCSFLRQGRFSTRFRGFNYISINNWSRCQLNCYYCDQGKAGWRKNRIVPYDPLPAIKSLYETGRILKGCQIDFGGGDPSVYEHLGGILDYILPRSFTCHINTNAVVFSKDIAKALSHEALTLSISPDAGTAENYRKVKGQDLFDKVAENVGRYSGIGRVNLKYNITPHACSPEDIRGFVDILKKSRIHSVKISPELHAYKAGDPDYRKVLDFARDIFRAVRQVHAHIELPFWTSGDAAFICSANNSPHSNFQ
jgi:sulfatase maturation enzyme AslB (radical SAM superfamily)